MNKKELITQALTALNDKIGGCSCELANEFGTADLQIKQFSYLQIIETTPELTFSRFAEILQITKPSVTEIVNKLIKLKCVEKVKSPVDGRIYYIELTEKGKKITQLKNLVNIRCAEDIVDVLTDDEVMTFVEIINKIVKENE